jgi:hypothetical protein
MKSREIAHFKAAQAIQHYDKCFQRPIYLIAIKNKSFSYANALKYEAMAICGSPHYKLSNRNWGNEAIEFLALFK